MHHIQFKAIFRIVGSSRHIIKQSMFHNDITAIARNSRISCMNFQCQRSFRQSIPRIRTIIYSINQISICIRCCSRVSNCSNGFCSRCHFTGILPFHNHSRNLHIVTTEIIYHFLFRIMHFNHCFVHHQIPELAHRSIRIR